MKYNEMQELATLCGLLNMSGLNDLAEFKRKHDISNCNTETLLNTLRNEVYFNFELMQSFMKPYSEIVKALKQEIDELKKSK